MPSQNLLAQFTDPAEKQEAQALLQLVEADKIPALNQKAMLQTLQSVIAAKFLPSPLPDAQSDLGAAIKSSLLMQYENDKQDTQNIQQDAHNQARATNAQQEVVFEKAVIKENRTQDAQNIAQNRENLALRDQALSVIAGQMENLASQPEMANLLADFNLSQAQAAHPQIAEAFKDSPDKQALLLKATYLLEQLQARQDQPEVAALISQHRDSLQSLSQSYNQLADSYTLPKIELKKPDALARETARKLSNGASATELIEQPAAMVAALEQNGNIPRQSLHTEAFQAEMNDLAALTTENQEPLLTPETLEDLKQNVGSVMDVLPTAGFVRTIANGMRNNPQLNQGSAFVLKNLHCDENGQVEIPLQFASVQSSLVFTAEGQAMFPDLLQYNDLTGTLESGYRPLPYATPKLNDFQHIVQSKEFNQAYRQSLQKEMAEKHLSKPEEIVARGKQLYQELYRQKAASLQQQLPTFNASVLNEFAQKQIQVEKVAANYDFGNSLKGWNSQESRTLSPDLQEHQAAIDYMRVFANPLLSVRSRTKIAQTQDQLKGLKESDLNRKSAVKDPLFSKYFSRLEGKFDRDFTD
ncbi:hypothetical protein SAMN05421780_1204 [Flexibacter flexilis DSM 6793]|uniref:Uncharacterized protein n=1 Tax=Flexibacter flexilis DSM 6793 TaxID=927664 RepID=A0A1I1NUY7_9BACT|nr:hypothetical protein [Flexibacter flexilis]SFD01216.1 hypothetical protein SAMN05421780_1204 [Flexibacter flexilis DSM 6793]